MDKKGRARKRPGQKKVKNLQRGTPLGGMGGNRRTIIPICAYSRQMATNGFLKQREIRKFRSRFERFQPVRRRFPEDRHSAGAPRRDASAGGSSAHWCRHCETAD